MIPIYRAKKIDGDEWVEGYYVFESGIEKHFIFKWIAVGYNNELTDLDYVEIDPNTLAIHFPNMIDKNGKKIFASLSEDGVGGDVTEFKKAKLHAEDTETQQFPLVMTYKDGSFIQKYIHPRSDWYTKRKFNFYELEVIGIHKG